jgi:tellurite resistance protein
MIWLSNSTLARLRDQLRVRGQRPSIATAEPGLGPDALALLGAEAEYGPFCEAMYLMMSADGNVGDEVLKGALRNLSDDGLRSVTIDALLAGAEERIASEGRQARLHDVGESLSHDSARAEVAFVLAAAIAFADNAIADQENETLNELAELLGIDENRANQLLDDVEQDLGRAPTTAT